LEGASGAVSIKESDSLEQQLLEYKAILDHSGIAVVCMRDRRVYRCNPRAEELFGWAAGSLVGPARPRFLPDSERLRITAPESALAVAGWQGQIVDLETEMARRDGSHLSSRT
jgi:PAS domain-containing protein